MVEFGHHKHMLIKGGYYKRMFHEQPLYGADVTCILWDTPVCVTWCPVWCLGT